MLFDLRGSGRRRTVQVIYGTLAVLMAGGLVFFGVGGAVGGGLFDAINGNGGANVSDTFAKRAASLEKQLATRPKDKRLWADLARARYQAATATGLDSTTGTFSESGIAKLRGAARAWERYLALNPRTPNAQVANLMVQVYGPGGLNTPAKATSAMEIVVASRPSSGLYAQLAQLAYLAGQTRKGDLAAAAAVSLAAKDQRPTLKSSLADFKKQAAAQTSTTPSTAP